MAVSNESIPNHLPWAASKNLKEGSGQVKNQINPDNEISDEHHRVVVPDWHEYFQILKKQRELHKGSSDPVNDRGNV